MAQLRSEKLENHEKSRKITPRSFTRLAMDETASTSCLNHSLPWLDGNFIIRHHFLDPEVDFLIFQAKLK